MKKQIIWESQHLEIDPVTSKLKHPNDIPEYKEIENDEMKEGISKILTTTSFGVWRIDDSMHPFKRFKLWVGHTNFNINDEVIMKLDKTEGVELLRVMTRYSFLIGVGQAFDPSNVKRNIELTLCNSFTITIPNPIVQNKVNKLKKILSANNYWTILAFPNGNIEFAIDNKNDEEFIKKIDIMDKAACASGGIIIKSDK